MVTIKTNTAQGTGFVISKEGYVVTNAHVLSGGIFANAITAQKESIPMKLIGYNQKLDIALLKITPRDSSLEFILSKDVEIGEKVIAIGNPLGLSFSVSEGIVSAKDRPGINQMPGYIQTEFHKKQIHNNKENINNRKKNIPLNKLGTTQNVADVISNLLLDDKSFITGQIITIDGGDFI